MYCNARYCNITVAYLSRCLLTKLFANCLPPFCCCRHAPATCFWPRLSYSTRMFDASAGSLKLCKLLAYVCLCPSAVLHYPYQLPYTPACCLTRPRQMSYAPACCLTRPLQLSYTPACCLTPPCQLSYAPICCLTPRGWTSDTSRQSVLYLAFGCLRPL